MAADRQFDVVLFDLEGTLVDFQWSLNAAADEILKVLINAGIDPSQYKEASDYAGLYNTTRDIISAWDTKDAVRLSDQLAVIYDKYDRDALSRWAPYPDTADVLSRLSAYRYRMGVVSNCGAYAVGKILGLFNLDGYFEIVLSREDVEYLKPRPEGLNQALKKFCVSAEKTLFVGDSLNDILAADLVSMSSCFLSNGESLITGQSADSATFQISSLAGIVNILC
ncbi:MAG: HAD family hydrolase [Desulfobacteraceae bacterium]|nr:HAD family hydrolase [Desulfobacteraceae bacterium]